MERHTRDNGVTRRVVYHGGISTQKFPKCTTDPTKTKQTLVIPNAQKPNPKAMLMWAAWNGIRSIAVYSQA